MPGPLGTGPDFRSNGEPTRHARLRPGLAWLEATYENFFNGTLRWVKRWLIDNILYLSIITNRVKSNCFYIFLMISKRYSKIENTSTFVKT